MMLQRKTISLFVLVFVVFTGNSPFLYAQSWVKGEVLDADNGRPIPNAAVFINTTTYGTVCNEDGTFELSAMPQLPFELTIAAVGYERAWLRIDRENVSDLHHVKLVPKVIMLEGVQIRPPVSDGWLLYGAKFSELFIGYSGFAQQCRILNEEVLDFYYDPDSFLLQVVANGPIEIENRATGYLITYWLEDFEFNFLSGLLFYKGQSQFKPLRTKRKFRSTGWVANRKSAYYGSLNHFIRSVYRGEAVEAGFEIRAMKSMKQSDTARFIPRRTDSFSFGNTEHLKAVAADYMGASRDPGAVVGFLQAFRQWKDDNSRMFWRLKGEPGPDSMVVREFRFSKTTNDSLFTRQYFEYAIRFVENSKAKAIASPEKKPQPNTAPQTAGAPLMLRIGKQGIEGDTSAIRRRLSGFMDNPDKEVRILFKELLPLDSIRKAGAQGTVFLDFEDYLLVTYTKEAAEAAYVEQISNDDEDAVWLQESVLYLRFAEPLRLQPDGNFQDPYNLFIESYWAYEKLDKLLPLDYQPGRQAD